MPPSSVSSSGCRGGFRCATDQRFRRRLNRQHRIRRRHHRNFSTDYSSSKWALEGPSRSAAYTYTGWGIRSNVIHPGFIETDLTAPMSSNPLMKKVQSSVMNNTVLLRRSGKANEIGYTALFLASDESSYITGTDIVVDGGWFSSAPYLANERSHHMLSLLDEKEHLEKVLRRFR